ncbi:MAG: alpha/beta hydrolase [bacterium]|nr:alpha/beta hydrolase [bacterium]
MILRQIMSSTFMVLVLLALTTVPSSAQSQGESQVLEGRGEFEIVLIHGLGSNAKVWDEVVPYLMGTFNVAVFEMAGHGKTQPIADNTITKEVLRLESFIKENGFVYPTLVGHGMGGMIALEYTMDHPSDVYRLMMIDSAPVQLASAEQKQNIAQALIDDYEHFVAARYSAMSPDEEVTEKIIDSAMKTEAATFVSLLMSSFDYDETERLKSLSVPLLVIGSELLFPNPEQNRAILDQIGFGYARSLSFKRFGRTGHFMMLERPSLTASVLLAFGVSAEHVFDY